VKRFILVAVSLTACKWTAFDDLAGTTWVRSQDKPNIGSTDYAISIAGASMGSDGGTLAVVGTDSPTFSTIVYDAKGGDKVGDNPLKLGEHSIATLSEKPILVNDGAGNSALVEKAIDPGQIAVVWGPAASPIDLPPFAGSPPTAAAYDSNGTLYIAAPATSGPNLFVVNSQTSMSSCTLNDAGGMPVAAAAIATDNMVLWVWTQDGHVMRYSLPCANSVTPTTSAQTFSPGTGAQIHIVPRGKTWGVLAARTPGGTTGEVVVFDLTGAPTAVTMPLGVDGLLSSAFATFDSKDYVVLGIPGKEVGTTTAGQVEIYSFDPATGALGDTPDETLNDAQPENEQLFGRDVTTMQYNGQQILVVAASNEVFAYYRTSVYPTDTRNPPPSP
jgi:hypothetical protein